MLHITCLAANPSVITTAMFSTTLSLELEWGGTPTGACLFMLNPTFIIIRQAKVRVVQRLKMLHLCLHSTIHHHCMVPSNLNYPQFKTNILCHSILPPVTHAAETPPFNKWIFYTLTCNIQHSAPDIRAHRIGCYALIIRFIWLPSCRDAENAIYKICLKSWTQTLL